MFVNVLVSVLTGLVTSTIVACLFYRFGRSDAKKERWVSRIDSVQEKLAYLDPRRPDSVRPGDGVDETSHAIRCTGAVMKFSGFDQGQVAVESIADEMVKWCASTEPKSYEDAMRIKARWTGQLEALVASLRKRPWCLRWWPRGSKGR